MHQHRVLPGKRWVIVGAGENADRLAEAIELAGAEVVGRSSNPGEVVASGNGAVEQVEIAGNAVDADTVVLALGELPDPELARHALAEITFDEQSGGFVPVRDETLQTTAAGIYAIGQSAGLISPAAAIAEGQMAAYAALNNAEAYASAKATLASLSASNGAAAKSEFTLDPAGIPDDVLVDREENITAGQVRQAISESAITVDDVKRRTRAGMGVSQGRDTEYIVARMIHAQAGIPLNQLRPMTARPPARLISLQAMASLATRTD